MPSRARTPEPTPPAKRRRRSAAPTILQLAQLAGVSDATVSLVLAGKDRGRVSPARREHILELARTHGYRYNPAAKALVEGKTYRIGLCLEGSIASHAVVGEMSLYVRLGQFAEGIHAQGYAIEIVQTDPHSNAKDAARELCRKAVDGLVLMHWQRQRAEEVLANLLDAQMPVVASGTELSGDRFSWTDVNVEEFHAQGVRRLVQEGCANLALLHTAFGYVTPTYTEGFVRAMRRELNVDATDRVFTPREVSSAATRCMTEEALNRLGRPQGILLTDNFYAQAVLDVLHSRGILPGRDCRVIGYGDTILADHCSPKLSHYDLRINAQVAFGLEALWEQIRNPGACRPRHRHFTPAYIARAT